MKTLLVALEYPPAIGGVETYYSKLTENWPEEISVLDNSRAELVRGFMSWLPGLFSVARRLRSLRPEWLIVGEILPIGTIAWLLSYFFTFKYAVILHGFDLSLATRNPFKRFLSRQIISRAQRIIAVNSYTAEQLRNFAPTVSERLSIVNPGADDFEIPQFTATKLRENYGLAGRFVILTLARLVKRKGADMVLRALASLIAKYPNILYVIIGKGPDQVYLQALIHELGLDANVILLPTVSIEEKAAWLSLCDVFAMPARDIDGDYEGFGIVYLDAGLAGKPVIAGRSGGVADAVTDGDNGLMVEAEDQYSIATAIENLYSDSELRERLGKRGRERALTLSWSTQIMKIYSALK